MDLKIACIALVHEASLLTRNTNDFAKVPGLRIEKTGWIKWTTRSSSACGKMDSRHRYC